MLRSIGEVCVAKKNADERVQTLVINTRFGTEHVLWKSEWELPVRDKVKPSTKQQCLGSKPG